MQRSYGLYARYYGMACVGYLFLPNANRESLADPPTREPLWRSNEIPIGGEQAEVREIISAYTAELRDCLSCCCTLTPALSSRFEPVDIWPGIHFVKEDGKSTVDRL